MQDVSVCTSLGPSPWVKGKHMEQGQHSVLYSGLFGFGYTIAEESSMHTSRHAVPGEAEHLLAHTAWGERDRGLIVSFVVNVSSMSPSV